MESPTPEEATSRERERIAHKLKARFRWLNRFTDDELRDISFCDEGEPLNADEQYFDLSHPEKGVVSGQAGQIVPEGSCYVTKRNVRPNVWQKLITVTREEYT